jgi:hypothetical protein
MFIALGSTFLLSYDTLTFAFGPKSEEDIGRQLQKPTQLDANTNNFPARIYSKGEWQNMFWELR